MQKQNNVASTLVSSAFAPSSRSAPAFILSFFSRPSVWAAIVILLLFLSPVIFSQATPGGTLFNPSSTYAGIMPLLILGMATMVFAAAFIFMLAQAFRTGEWESQAKTEIYHVITTCIWGL